LILFFELFENFIDIEFFLKRRDVKLPFLFITRSCVRGWRRVRARVRRRWVSVMMWWDWGWVSSNRWCIVRRLSVEWGWRMRRCWVMIGTTWIAMIDILLATLEISTRVTTRVM